MDESYWKDLVSTGMHVLQGKGNDTAVFVIRNGIMVAENNYHDNWNGGTDYWDIVITLKLGDYISLGDKKNLVEQEILGVLNELHSADNERISTVIIKPEIKRIIDWYSVRPATKESTIKLIQEEQKVLTDVATCEVAFVGNRELEASFQERHKIIMDIAQRAGFDYPVSVNTLNEWWVNVRCMHTHIERKEYISKLFSPIIKNIKESDETIEVDFSSIVKRSETIKKSIDDALAFSRDGKYDSAFDRVHTAFHDYLRQLLIVHGVDYGENESLPSLYSKLHNFYEEHIQPPEVGNRIKSILRSAGGMVNAVNELRNNNTVVHPNSQLIQKREAQLAIRLVNAVIDYVEDIETSLKS